MKLGCPFCGIAFGDRNSHRVYDDADTIAFLDSNPAADGHTLIAPKQHRASIIPPGDSSLPNELQVLPVITTAIQDVFDPDGFSVFHTTTTLFGDVEHAHIHVIPRYKDDRIQLSLHRNEFDEEAARKIARELRNRCMP